MAGRVGEQRDDLVHLEERSWPAVSYHQWHRVWPLAFLVDKVDSDSVDIGLEMGKGINECLLGSPIKLSAAVIDQFPDVVQIAPVIAAVARNLVRLPSTV